MQINPDYDADKNQTPAADDDRDLVIFLTYVACLNNLAACYIEMGEQLKARDMCIKVLEIDPYNLKALFRAAKSSLALHVRKNSFYS